MASDSRSRRHGHYRYRRAVSGCHYRQHADRPALQTPAEAGAGDGKSHLWTLEEGNDYDIFEGVWTLSGTKVGRATIWQSKIGNVHHITKMTLAGNATLRSITPVEAFNYIPRVDKDQSASFSETQKARGRGNLYAATFAALACNGMQINVHTM